LEAAADDDALTVAHLKGYADGRRAAEAKLAEVVEALRKLHHSVCGETGFASCVRIDSGKAYPWPALDEADELARTTLAELKGDTQNG
jgi:hypothetical protein